MSGAMRTSYFTRVTRNELGDLGFELRTDVYTSGISLFRECRFQVTTADALSQPFVKRFTTELRYHHVQIRAIASDSIMHNKRNISPFSGILQTF